MIKVFKKLSIVLISEGAVFYMGTVAKYNIGNSEEDVQKVLSDKWKEKEHYHSSGTPEQVKITKLGDSNKSIATFMLNGNMDYALLEEGWTGSYHLEKLELGTEFIAYKGIETNEGSYGVVFGKLFGRDIGEIHAHIKKTGHQFSMDISGNESFVRYEKLPGRKAYRYRAHLTY